MALLNEVSIDLLLELRKHAHLPQVLIRQINGHFQQKAGVQSILLRQLKDRHADLEEVEQVADLITDEAWGTF